MSILLDATTKVVVQGITGREGSFHTEQMKELGTKVVAGTSPGKGGTTHLDLPVFNTVADAVKATGSAPKNTSPPTISGTTQEGSTVTVAPGSWAGTPAPKFSFQWQRCVGTGGGCADVSGATSTSFTRSSRPGPSLSRAGPRTRPRAGRRSTMRWP